MTKINRRAVSTFVVLSLLVMSFVALAAALPEGPSLSIPASSNRTAANGTGHTAGKGSINYAQLTATQQNMRWKAYVGNVSGSLVLQDAEGYNIYDWLLTTSINGTILASRNNTLNFNALNCTNGTTMIEEQTSLSFGAFTDDNINRTFNSTNHTQFMINNLPLSNCSAVYTFQNSTRQPTHWGNGTNVFQEISIQDTSRRVAYATKIYNDLLSYKNDLNTDFQMLLPDYGNTSITGAVTYYFFVELT